MTHQEPPKWRIVKVTTKKFRPPSEEEFVIEKLVRSKWMPWTYKWEWYWSYRTLDGAMYRLQEIQNPDVVERQVVHQA